jgi:holo-[acyl-carrier protein] synthase
MKRVLTEPERTYFWERFGPHRDIQLRLDTVSEFLAGR